MTRADIWEMSVTVTITDGNPRADVEGTSPGLEKCRAVRHRLGIPVPKFRQPRRGQGLSQGGDGITEARSEEAAS